MALTLMSKKSQFIVINLEDGRKIKIRVADKNKKSQARISIDCDRSIQIDIEDRDIPQRGNFKCATCENCGADLPEYSAIEYENVELFCSLVCNREYKGEISGNAI